MEPNPAEHYPVCAAGHRAAPSEECGGPQAYQRASAQHRYDLPLEELERVSDAVQGFLDTGDRSALGDAATLRSALERLEVYNGLEPDRFDCQAINARLRYQAIGAGGEV